MISRKPKLSLFLFIDAFGWEVKQKYPFFLKDLIQDSKPLETILGYSSACDPSIISGLTPSQHKLWNSYYYDPENSPFTWTKPLGALTNSISGHARVRHHLGKWIKKRCGFDGYFQLYQVPLNQLHHFNYAEQKRIWEPGGLPHGQTIFDLMAEQHIPYSVHDSRHSDQQRIQNLHKNITSQSIEFAYCSLGQLDALMHAKGNNHPDIEPLMHWYDAKLRELITSAHEHYDDVAWYIFTDHGMHNITGTRDLISEVKTLGLKWNRDYIAFYDSTMARFWFMNDHARSAITEYLETHSSGSIISDEELKKQGVFFEDRQYGELIFLLKPGIQIVPSFMSNKACKGMHGFTPDDSDSNAQISSNKPIPASVTKIQHIHQLMLSELDLYQSSKLSGINFLPNSPNLRPERPL